MNHSNRLGQNPGRLNIYTVCYFKTIAKTYLLNLINFILLILLILWT